VSVRKTAAPYGSWKSPITAERIVEAGVSLGQVALDGSDIYWSEMRPAEGGRHVILRWRHGAMEEMVGAPFSARTRAHEYGGGAFAVDDGVLYFSNDRDQLLYRFAPENPPQAITVTSPPWRKVSALPIWIVPFAGVTAGSATRPPRRR